MRLATDSMYHTQKEYSDAIPVGPTLDDLKRFKFSSFSKSRGMCIGMCEVSASGQFYSDVIHWDRTEDKSVKAGGARTVSYDDEESSPLALSPLSDEAKKPRVKLKASRKMKLSPNCLKMVNRTGMYEEECFISQ